VLEPDGYHLTPATPKTTTLSSVVESTPQVLRSGYPATLRMTVRNTGTRTANNVRMLASLPGSLTGGSLGGTSGWIFQPTGDSVQARRGVLEPGATAEMTMTFIPQTTGSVQVNTSWLADETTGGAGNALVSVLDSFKNWTSGLPHPDVTGDDDGDGLNNLMEYAFGGDPVKSATNVIGSATGMLPVPLRTEKLSGDRLREIIQYVRRTDAAARQLDYRVEVSDGLEAWTDTAGASSELSVTPLGGGFERVELALPPATSDRQFFRVRVNLEE
jgi:uncharacterized repeat protein (TIGR01451 family)